MDFFYKSDFLDLMVTRPLSHIRENWELSWNIDKIELEDNSFAELLNEVIFEIDRTPPPENYHNNEDVLAEYVITKLNWNIYKDGNRWICPDYNHLIEQGGYADYEEKNLIASASGRILAAKEHGQIHFDDMEEGHQKILANVLAVILYHRGFRQT